jgi:sugar (pentulose or hexulose) kinase
VRLLRELGVEVDRIRCVGGGSRNALWNQIKADVVQLPLELSDEPEAGLKGAALLGAAGVGRIDNLVEAAQPRQPGSVVQPQTDRGEWSRQALDEFSRIYEHMLGFWQQ